MSMVSYQGLLVFGTAEQAYEASMMDAIVAFEDYLLNSNNVLSDSDFIIDMYVDPELGRTRIWAVAQRKNILFLILHSIIRLSDVWV